MANQYNSRTNAKFQALVTAISNLLPAATRDIDLASAPGFTLKLTVSPDGQTLTVQTNSSDQGQNNAFGPVDGGIGGRLSRRSPLIIPATSMP